MLSDILYAKREYKKNSPWYQKKLQEKPIGSQVKPKDVSTDNQGPNRTSD